MECKLDKAGFCVYGCNQVKKKTAKELSHDRIYEYAMSTLLGRQAQIMTVNPSANFIFEGKVVKVQTNDTVIGKYRCGQPCTTTHRTITLANCTCYNENGKPNWSGQEHRVDVDDIGYISTLPDSAAEMERFFEDCEATAKEIVARHRSGAAWLVDSERAVPTAAPKSTGRRPLEQGSGGLTCHISVLEKCRRVRTGANKYGPLHPRNGVNSRVFAESRTVMDGRNQRPPQQQQMQQQQYHQIMTSPEPGQHQHQQIPQQRFAQRPQMMYEVQPMDGGENEMTYARVQTAQQQHPTVSALLRSGPGPQLIQVQNPNNAVVSQATSVGGVPLVIPGQQQVICTQPQQIIVGQRQGPGGPQMVQYIQTSVAGGQPQYATLQQHLQQQQPVYIQQQPQQQIMVQQQPQQIPQSPQIQRQPPQQQHMQQQQHWQQQNNAMDQDVQVIAQSQPQQQNYQQYHTMVVKNEAPRVSPMPRSGEQNVMLPMPMARAPPPRNDAQEEVGKFEDAVRTNTTARFNSQHLLTPETLDGLAKQVDASAILDDGLKDALVCYVDEYVQMIIDKSSEIAKHRGSRRIEHRDVAFALQKYFDMGDLAMQSLTAAGQNANPPTAQEVLNGGGGSGQSMTAHNQRVALIKKTLKKP